MSDANLTKIGYIAEVTPGVTPTTPTLARIRTTGDSLNLAVNFASDTEIRSDRQKDTIAEMSRSVGGDVSFELSLGTLDDFLLAALMADTTWTTPLTIADCSANSTAAAYVHSTRSLTLTATTAATFGASAAALPLGTMVRIRGAVEPKFNGYFRVKAWTSGTVIVLDGTPGGFSGDDSETLNTSAQSVVAGAFAKNGVLPYYFTFEKTYTALTEFMAYRGTAVSAIALTMAAQQFISGSLTLMGRTGDTTGASVSGSAYAEPTASPVLSATTNVAKLLEAGASIASPNFVNSVSFTLDNAMRQLYGVGNSGPVDDNFGRISVTGDISAYFGDRTLYEKYVAGTESQLTIATEDADLRALVIDMPRVKFTAGSVPTPGLDQDITASMTYDALRSTDYGFTVGLTKFA